MTEENLDTQEWKPSINPWIATIPVILANFIFALDGTIANVALSHMGGTFATTRDESVWILTSYLIASGIVIPAVDWFSRLLGRKNFFMLSILMFTVASVLCGLAQNIETMVLARILQGLGGGGIIPVSQAILLESFPKEKRGMAMSLFALGVIIAPIVGPVLGGWITDNWSWPWIFFINAPIGAVALSLCAKFLEDPPYAKKQKNVHIDWVGFLFLIIWLVTLQITLDKGNNADWFNAKWVRWMSGISIFSCIVFFVSQTKIKDPLVNINVFKDSNYTIGTIIQIVIQTILYSSLAILPQFLQTMMGYTAYLSGLAMMPRGLGALISTAICSALSNKIDNRLLVAIGLILIGVSNSILGSLNLQIASMNIVIPNFIMGMGMGLSMIPIITLSVNTLKNEQMTNASGLQSLLRNIGGAVGTSLVATSITRFGQIHQYMLVKNLTQLNEVYNAKLQAMTAVLSQFHDLATATYLGQNILYKQLMQQATTSAFIDTFRIFAVAAFLPVGLLVFLKTQAKSDKLSKG